MRAIGLIETVHCSNSSNIERIEGPDNDANGDFVSFSVHCPEFVKRQLDHRAVSFDSAASVRINNGNGPDLGQICHSTSLLSWRNHGYTLDKGSQVGPNITFGIGTIEPCGNHLFYSDNAWLRSKANCAAECRSQLKIATHSPPSIRAINRLSSSYRYATTEIENSIGSRSATEQHHGCASECKANSKSNHHQPNQGNLPELPAP